MDHYQAAFYEEPPLEHYSLSSTNQLQENGQKHWSDFLSLTLLNSNLSETGSQIFLGNVAIIICDLKAPMVATRWCQGSVHKVIIFQPRINFPWA